MVALLGLAGGCATFLAAQAPDAVTTIKTEHFDQDPGWPGHNNRIGRERPPVTVKQDFGHADGVGKVGGFVMPAAEPAYYAAPLSGAHTLEQPLSAAGSLVVAPGGGNTLVGFFNRGALNEWRTPSTIALRINGRGEEGFHVHVEYCTARWRAGGDFFGAPDPQTGRKSAKLFAPGVPHHWSLRYDPAGNGGAGAVHVTFAGEELVLNLDPGHKADGAAFNRFGILNFLKSFDGGGSLWLDGLQINGGPTQPFDADPNWEALNNRRTYETRNVRPWFDFGFSPTNHAGGAAPGEIGGLHFRGDERYPDRLAYYGDDVGDLTLNDRLHASGKVCLRRGVTDSTVLLGYFHAKDSLRHSEAQRSGFPENFLGVAIEGPSRDGFFFYPVYSLDEEGTTGYANGDDRPHILPDGTAHDWTMRYEPDAAGGGRIVVALDGRAVSLDVSPDHRRAGARFNRFGFVTTHIDGNGQEVFLDDLTYSVSASRPDSSETRRE